MLTPEETSLMRELLEAVNRGDHVSIEAIRQRLEARDGKTAFDYLLLWKASQALGLTIKADTAEIHSHLKRLADGAHFRGVPVEEINLEKEIAATSGEVFDEKRAMQILDCIQRICDLALQDSDDGARSLALSSRSLSFVATLAEEYEAVAPDVSGLANLSALRELLIARPYLVVGAAEAAILAKYAFAGARDDAEVERINQFLRRNRISEGASVGR